MSESRPGQATTTPNNDARFAALPALIGLVLVSSERPALPRASEVRGLNLLDLTLRMDHVSRITQTLQLSTRGTCGGPSRWELDRRALTSRHRKALAVNGMTSAERRVGSKYGDMPENGGPRCGGST
jgi:hypothetical protein